MSLVLLREIEDLKAILNEAISRYQKCLKQDTKRIIASICADFEKHMRLSSFQVETIESTLVATYKNLSFTLIPPQTEDKQAGSITAFKLKDSRQLDEVYVVLVIDSETRGNCMEWRTSSSNEADTLKKQIERLRSKTAAFKARSFHFVFYPEREPPEEPYLKKCLSQPLPTINALMETISSR
jgi:hypothetical protein